MIEKGNIVTVHYTGKFVDGGEVFDSSLESEPISFEVGTNQIIVGFENAILGKKVGDKIETGSINPLDAYGDYREDLLVELPFDKEKIPADVTKGSTLQAVDPDGNSTHVTVVDVNEETVKIDGNHPLAGKEIEFDIEIVDVKTKENV
jgi:peptidylprolyl isomerase